MIPPEISVPLVKQGKEVVLSYSYSELSSATPQLLAIETVLERPPKSQLCLNPCTTSPVL